MKKSDIEARSRSSLVLERKILLMTLLSHQGFSPTGRP